MIFAASSYYLLKFPGSESDLIALSATLEKSLTSPHLWKYLCQIRFGVNYVHSNEHNLSETSSSIFISHIQVSFYKIPHSTP